MAHSSHWPAPSRHGTHPPYDASYKRSYDDFARNDNYHQYDTHPTKRYRVSPPTYDPPVHHVPYPVHHRYPPHTNGAHYPPPPGYYPPPAGHYHYPPPPHGWPSHPVDTPMQEESDLRGPPPSHPHSPTLNISITNSPPDSGEPVILTPSTRSPPETPLNRFRKIGWCGDGTFGKVWSAKEIATDRVVALKQIKMNGTEGFPRTAIREIKIMRKALHENILSITEVVWSDTGDVFLVMDYYDYDLRKLLEKHQVKFNPAEVKFLLKQLVSGVKYLHDNQLLHRDLKTENILLDNQGRLKICDFGLARKIESDKPKQYTPVVVTLWYRSPELLLGEILENFQPYKFEIDQWSVGCIFGELVRSSVLFAGTNSFEQVDKIFQIMGTPTEKTWPGYLEYPKSERYSFRNYPNKIRNLFVTGKNISHYGFELLEQLIQLDPAKRPSIQDTINHPYFTREEPQPVKEIDIRQKRQAIQEKKV